MQQITHVTVDVLKVHPRNLEFFDDISGEDYEQFKASIKEEGIITEIIVAPDMTILSGHQRYKAAKELGLKTVPIRIREDAETEEQKLKLLLAANFGRKENSPGKKRKVAAEYVALCGYGHGGSRCQNGTMLTLDEIAAQLGTNKRSLQRCLKIERDLSEDMKQLLDDGVISETFAADVIAGMTEEEQIKLISKLDATKKYTARELDKFIKGEQSDGENLTRREKFEKARADMLKKSNDELKEKITLLENKSQTNHEDKTDKSLAKELENLRIKYDELLSQKKSYEEELKELRNNALSPAAKSANMAYDFYLAASDIVGKYLSPAAYDNSINEDVNGLKNQYFVKACNLLTNAISDVYRNANVVEEISVY